MSPSASSSSAPIGEGEPVDPDELELGVVVQPSHWGSGIAAEAGLAVARDVFERVGRDAGLRRRRPDERPVAAGAREGPGVRKVNDELYELRRLPT